ncbi:glycosyltransferase family 39 protein [Namhaeicola litoreus]|uniref:Glycosyltransferase family 39 protein n=1 Tax=Namhaeicola litoreus TaxID=1052145 RepID=A0ABW3Y1T5_9FLAO
MNNTYRFYIFLLICSFFLFFQLGSFGVLESSDARYAEIAREMMQTDDYLNPILMGIHHFHKPPLTYDITILGYKLFGVNPFGARFFLQIALLIQLLLIFELYKLLFHDKKGALFAALIYFSFPLVLISTRNLTTDAYLNTFILSGIYFWVRYRQEDKLYFLYFFTISLALGFLTKGPVVLIVPVIFTVFYNRLQKSNQDWTIHHVLAWIIFLVLSGSWFVYLITKDEHFLNYFLGRHTVARFSENAFDRSEPFWYFILLTPLFGLPWLALLPYFIKKHINNFNTRSIYFVLLMSISIPLLFFSISTSKRVLYILPIFSLLAILTSRLLSITNGNKLLSAYRFIFLFVLLLSLFFIALPFLGLDIHIPNSLLIYGILMAVIDLIVLLFFKWDLKVKMVGTTYVWALILILAGDALLIANQELFKSASPITEFLEEHHLNKRNIIVYNELRPSVAFELNKPIISLDSGNKNLNREIEFETNNTWKKYLINMHNPEEVTNFKNNTDFDQTVLIVYKGFHPEDEWLKNEYKNSHKLEKLMIYY